MGYIEDNLLHDEQVVYITKLHGIIFAPPSIILLIGFITLSIGMFVDTNIVMLLGFLVSVVAIIWILDIYISFVTSEFGITNKRILVKAGFIRRNSLEILLSKIEGIEVNQGIFGRMFNYGTIIVKGIGGTNDPYDMIESPFELRRKLQEQISILQYKKGMPSHRYDEMKCPYCAEVIKTEAKVCRFCNREL